MSRMNKQVVFIVYKYSIVVRGIERKLTDYGYKVSILTEKYEQISALSAKAGVVVLYLAGNIAEDVAGQRALTQICDNLKKCNCTVIIIGENKYRDAITLSHPELKEYIWLNKPIDSESFCNIIEEMFKTSDNNDSNSNMDHKNTTLKRILIVDDDPAYASMVRAWIKDIYKTDVVTAGMKAITFLLKNPVDIILLDYDMPIVDGPQVLQMLRQEEATRNIPVVFLTGVSTKEGVKRGIELKPDGYILKSATREELLSYLDKKLS